MRCRFSIALFAILVMFIVASPAVSKCPRCVAKYRVHWMARHNYRGHPPSYDRYRGVDMNQFSTGATFEGCGWSSGGSIPGTCVPNRGRQLLADEMARGSNGVLYRLRLWR